MNGTREQDVFDELWLVVYSPIGLHFFKHPGGTVGYVETGLRMNENGPNIVFTASAHVLDVEAALEVIMQKMEQKGCHLFAEVLWDN